MYSNEFAILTALLAVTVGSAAFCGLLLLLF